MRLACLRVLTQKKITTRSDLVASYVKDQINHMKYNNVPKKVSAIRLATYNVHFWYDPTGSHVSYNNILKTIRELDIDILILEEVTMGVIPIDKLYEDLGSLGYNSNNIIFGDASRYMGGAFGNLIASKYPIVQSKVESLVKYQVGRSAVIVDIIVNNKILRVYGFHLDVFDVTETTRLNQINSILHSANMSPFPVILAGDYNSVRRLDYSEVEWNLIVERDKERNVQTKCLVTNSIENNGWISSFVMMNLPSPKYTNWSGTTIDFIYLNKDHWTTNGNSSDKFQIIGTYVYHSYDSDHIPVLMDFRVSN